MWGAGGGASGRRLSQDRSIVATPAIRLGDRCANSGARVHRAGGAGLILRWLASSLTCSTGGPMDLSRRDFFKLSAGTPTPPPPPGGLRRRARPGPPPPPTPPPPGPKSPRPPRPAPRPPAVSP